MATSFYDVVVLGEDLGATVAGAVLAHRGFRVLLAGAPPEERYALGPYMLPRSPLAFVGLESPALKRVVAELNLVQLLRRRLEPNRPAYQLLLDDHRIDVDDDLGRQLARELPDEAGGAIADFEAASARAAEISATLETILGQDLILPPDGFWDRRDANRVGARLVDDEIDFAAPLPATHPLRALLSLPATFGADMTDLGAVGTARLSDLHRRGTFRLDGGREGLRGLLIERLRTHSGEVRPELAARAISVKRGRVSGVLFEGQSEVVGCTHVLCGMGADQVLALLDGEKAPRRLAEAAAIKPAAWRYHLHLVAPLDALPDALGLVAFAQRDLAAPARGKNAIALHLADGYGQHAVLTAEVLAEDPSPAALSTLRGDVLRYVDELLPFIDRHLLAIHSPHDGLAPERTDAAYAAPMLPLSPVWRIPGERALGVCGVPHATGIKHLLLASRQVLPGLGLEGEIAAGWGAARLVLQTERKRDLVKGAVLQG